MISVLVPVLGRPANAAPLVASIQAASAVQPQIVFLCSPGDDEQLNACITTDQLTLCVDWPPGPGDFARKINYGFHVTKHQFVLVAADDVFFHPGWDTAVLTVAKRTQAGVIGTNDMGNPSVSRRHEFSTHPLVRRSYIDKQGGSLDGPGVVLHEGYDHNFVDRELWDLAASRQQTAFAVQAKIEHLHPHWGKGKMDATYEKGRKHFVADQRLYWSRSEQWGGILSPRQQAELRRFRRRVHR